MAPSKTLPLLLLFLLSSLPSPSVSLDCTYVPHLDFDPGSGGPNAPAEDAAACCLRCSAAGPGTCYAAVFDYDTGGICWLKTQDQTTRPRYETSNITACFPPGSVPPAPQPWSAAVLSRPTDPVISFLAGQTLWPQSFNPAWVEASPGTGGKRGLLVRSQNCTGWTPGQCIGCNVDGNHPIAPYFPGSVLTFAEQKSDGSFQEPYLVFAPDGSANEDYGTEDPRCTYNNATGLYDVFYTCFSSTIGPRLCHATTPDPTAPLGTGNWTRLGDVFPTKGAGTKSAALLLRPAPPHYLIWGAGTIGLATSDDLVTFTPVSVRAAAGGTHWLGGYSMRRALTHPTHPPNPPTHPPFADQRQLHRGPARVL
jgi:hypothetical protein